MSTTTTDLSKPYAVAAREAEEIGDDCTEEVRAQKKAKRAPLHEDYSAPLSFLQDALKAAQSDNSFNLTAIGKPFGSAREAYVRQCYEDVGQKINGVLNSDTEKKRKLFVLRGSSGVGKSTFLAYGLVRLRSHFGKGKILLCHAEKSDKGNELGAVCEVWENGISVVSGRYLTVENQIDAHMPTTVLVVMDGCSLPLKLEGFKGTILMAASPSLYIKNIEDSVFINRRRSYTIPPLTEEEAFGIGSLIGVDHEVVKTNLLHMGGIARYLFEQDSAKRKVEEAVEQVNAEAITKLVSMQASSKGTELLLVYALVLWKVDGEDYEGAVRFELVSRFAENLVARKLTLDTLEELKAARKRMAPLSGAKGYAGALFEAYAIRTLQAGGTFTMRNLSDDTTSSLKIPPLGDPVVIETNKVTISDAPAEKVRRADGKGGFLGTLLWPTTTNFPTFDCFYFHLDGKIYALQMTIAMNHDLKNSGADNAKNYFDSVLGSQKTTTYPAVFVVPADLEPLYAAQKFKGEVNKKAKDMSNCFDQFVLGL
jgi:hypothetical protein